MKLKQGSSIIAAIFLLPWSSGYAERVQYPAARKMAPLPPDLQDKPYIPLKHESENSIFVNPLVTESLKSLREEEDASIGLGEKKSFGSLPSDHSVPEDVDTKSTIGYSNVVEALEDLKKKPDVEIRNEDGWTIINQEVGEDMFVWSFAPHWHPAYPALARRKIYKKDGIPYVTMVTVCYADNAICGSFREEFRKLNQRVFQQIEGNPRFGAPKEPDTRPKRKCIPGRLGSICDN